MAETTSELAGVWAAVVTPVDADFAPDASMAIPYYQGLLDGGCDGLNVLGTTGEAISLSASQRKRFMEAIANSLLPTKRMMVGTGASSLDDTVTLTQAALDLGFAAALVMPPFFYRDATDDGIVSFYSALCARVPGLSQGRLILYNFPAMSGITFHPSLVDRLIDALPGAVAGVKDSSNDAALQAEIITRHRALRVFPGSEAQIPEGKRYGIAGVVSGSVCLWPRLASNVFHGDDRAHTETLASLRGAISGLPFIPAVRQLVARTSEDPRWELPIPPLVALNNDHREELERRLETLSARSVPTV